MSNIITDIKLSGVTYQIQDSTAIHSLDGYWNSGQTESAITAATSALAETIAEQGYQTSGDVQNAISGKADTTAVTQSIAEATSGKLDTSTFNTYSGAVDTALASKFAGAEYDSNSKHINFYDNASNTGTPLTYVDASAFIKDGMVDNVEVKEVSGVTSLVITFNTDAGKEDIVIPITDIFDASNYYTTAQTNSAIEAATSGKADTSAVTAVNDVVTAHTANTNIHLDATEKANLDSLATNIATISGISSADTASWSGKQDALVNQVNIKSINGTSLLGSGDIEVQTLPTVSGTTLIFS